MTTIGSDYEEIPIRLVAGEPVDFTVAVLDVDDLDGWTGLAEVRHEPGGELLHTFTLGFADDVVRVTATGAQTSDWADWHSTLARWELWVTPPNDPPWPLTGGSITVRPPITKVSFA